MILCGLHSLGIRIAEQLHLSGSPAVAVAEDAARAASLLDRWGIACVVGSGRRPHVLHEAGIGGAAALICVEEDALVALETVLVARDLRPDLRMVVQMANAGVGHALTGLIGPRSVLDTAALAAPSIVEACRRQAAKELSLGGERFAVVDHPVPASGTLRDLIGDLAPVAVVDQAGAVELSPGRDTTVSAGDTVTVIGAPDDFARAGVPLEQPPTPAGAAHARPRWLGFPRRVALSAWSLADRPLRWTLLVFVAVLVVSTVVLRLSYLDGGPRLSVLTAAFYTVETVATIGFGSGTQIHDPAWLEVFLTALIIIGVAFVTSVFALVTNLLFSRQMVHALGRQRVTHMRDHVVVIGFGAVGVLVARALVAAGEAPVVIERDDANRHLAQGRALGLPIVIGDGTLAETLDAANVTDASAVAVLTSNDLTNIETGLAVRDHLGPDRLDVPVVMRIFDRSLARGIERSFAFRNVRSTSALAAPWFVGAALGLDVLSTFYVRQELLLVARLTVAPSGGLAGVAMQDLPDKTRVVALGRAAKAAGAAATLEHPPRRDTRFAPGDQAYLIGPYDELLAVLRRDATAGELRS